MGFLVVSLWFRGIWLVFIRFHLDLMGCMTNWMAGLPAIRREMFWYGEKNGHVEILPLTIWLVEADDGRNQRRPTRDPERDSSHRRKSRRESTLSSESEADPGVPFDQQYSDPEEMQENIDEFPGARPWAMLTSYNWTRSKRCREDLEAKNINNFTTPACHLWKSKKTNKAPFSERFWTLRCTKSDVQHSKWSPKVQQYRLFKIYKRVLSYARSLWRRGVLKQLCPSHDVIGFVGPRQWRAEGQRIHQRLWRKTQWFLTNGGEKNIVDKTLGIYAESVGNNQKNVDLAKKITFTPQK